MQADFAAVCLEGEDGLSLVVEHMLCMQKTQVSSPASLGRTEKDPLLEISDNSCLLIGSTELNEPVIQVGARQFLCSLAQAVHVTIIKELRKEA